MSEPKSDTEAQRKVFVVLPAYNEQEGLEKLLARLRMIRDVFQLDIRVLVVDDGSRDHTVDVVRCFRDALPVELHSFERNRGVVEVFRHAFGRVIADGRDHDYCVTLDGDNTHNPFYLLDLVRALDHGADVVIASRFAPGGRMIGAPFVRNLLSLCVAALLRQVVALPGVRDYSTFYRGYRVSVLRQAAERWGDDAFRGEGFSCMARFLILLGQLTPRIVEVPFVLRYDLKEGGSGMRVFRTIRGYLAILWEFGHERRRSS